MTKHDYIDNCWTWIHLLNKNNNFSFSPHAHFNSTTSRSAASAADNECWVCITYHVTAVSQTMWLLLFSIVFKTLRIIWCHKRHCDVMILLPIRTALAIVEAFSGIHFSNIYWIGLSWRFCRRFAVCSYKSNQTFECWIQISRYFFNLSKNQLC